MADFKITKYGDVVEAKTVQWSSLLCLVHPLQSLISKGLYFVAHSSLFFIITFSYLYSITATLLKMSNYNSIVEKTNNSI